MGILNIFKFKKKDKIEREELEGKNAREICNIIKREDNEEFSLTFKMPKQVFKSMLPLIGSSRTFPIMFSNTELNQMTQDFMIDQKSKIVLEYGIQLSPKNKK